MDIPEESAVMPYTWEWLDGLHGLKGLSSSARILTGRQVLCSGLRAWDRKVRTERPEFPVFTRDREGRASAASEKLWGDRRSLPAGGSHLFEGPWILGRLACWQCPAPPGASLGWLLLLVYIVLVLPSQAFCGAHGLSVSLCLAISNLLDWQECLL